MRKHQQRQIQDLLQTIKEAQSAAMYADCQDGALFVGEYIETIMGEGTKTVAYLEEYCELLYKVSIGETSAKQLNKYITLIENGIKTELKPTKTEIVFISYKASMSDSIESIYLAAKADPNCDAYWLPVPYYDKKPNGALGTMHYEGPEFYPGNIICTDWREYDFDARRPDAVFTFNPYDAGNIVTTIHPSFYCEHLRSVTDMLVYVPYFVSLDEVSEHFCTVAGCAFAHKVILQSEKIREIYIREFKKLYGNEFGRPEDKFVALGSPKLDKVLNSKREDFELPAQWQQLIGDKKAILYNTTIGAMLERDERYLKKMRYVFDTFKDRNDIVLWWRPHPLAESTLESMRPNLLAEYKQIVDDYRQESWGIYDDTPDLHRAIARTNAYYGDWGSLVPMFHSSGKPMMIQNTSITSSSDRSIPNILSSYYADDGSNLWFASMHFNALLKMDKTASKVEFVGTFPEEQSTHYLFLKPIETNGKIYFPPFSAENIGVYCIKENTFRTVPFHSNESCSDTKRAFIEAVAYNKYIYFTPFMYPSIIQLNTLTNEVRYFSDWLEPLRKLTNGFQDGYFSYPATVGSSLMFTIGGANAVLEFNMDTNTSTVHEVGEKGNRYGSICYDGENYWLSPWHNTPVIKWNPLTGETKEFSLCSDVEDGHTAFIHIVYYGEHVWLLPYESIHALKINVHTDEVSIAEKFEPVYADPKEKEGIKYRFIQILGDNFYAYKQQNRSLLVYDYVADEHKETALKYPLELADQFEPYIAKTHFIRPDAIQSLSTCFYSESETTFLYDYINYIALYDNTKESEPMKNNRLRIARSLNSNAGGTAGAVIYKYTSDFIKLT